MKSPVSLIVKAIFFTILCFLSKQTIAQVDSLHYIPPMCTFNTTDVGKHQIVLTTSETNAFTVTITNADGSFNKTISLSAIAPQKINLVKKSYTIQNTYIPVDSIQGVIDTLALNTALKTEGLIISGPKKFFASIQQRSKAQGDFLSSKGTTALGMDFYSGHMAAANSKPSNNNKNGHFISVMATENNTNITFSNPRIIFKGQSQNSFTISLKKNQSYVVGIPFNDLINKELDVNAVNGTHITSNKPIAVNSGSWNGSGIPKNNAEGIKAAGRDIGFDQIVPTEAIGKEYILIKGEGKTKVGNVDKPGAKYNERAIIIATENDTKITYQYIDSTTNSIKIISKTLQQGQYHITKEDEFVNSKNGNLYINADKKIFVYQTLSGANERQTAGFCFIPPLKCTADKEVTIAFTNELAGSAVKPILKLITQAGSTVELNNVVIDPKYRNTVIGNSFWETYNIPNDELVKSKYESGTNSIFKIESTGALNAMLAVRSGDVGAGGFYSGFGDIPQINQNPQIAEQGLCGDNVMLTASGFTQYNWYKDGVLVAENDDASYQPSNPGRYKVTGVSPCGNTDMESFPSNEIHILPCLYIKNSDITVTEGDDSKAVFTVELSHIWTTSDHVDVTFDYQTTAGSASSGKDFTSISASGIIPSGQKSIDIEIPIIDDNLNENSENFTITINNVKLAVESTHTGMCTILDDNDPEPNIRVDDMTVNENAGTILLPIKLNIESGKTVSVNYNVTDFTATKTNDYSASIYDGSLSFLPGETTKNITLTIIDDHVYETEINEQFKVNLSNLSNTTEGNVNASISITDNDSKPDITIADASAEEGSPITFQATVNHPSSQNITFDYEIQFENGRGNAKSQDFSNFTSFSSGTITIPAGSSNVDFPAFTTIDDNSNEGTEVFTLKFTNSNHANLTNIIATGSIRDNEGKPTISIQNAPDKTEGNALQFTININPAKNTPITFQYKTSDGTATSPTDFEGSSDWTSVTIPENKTSYILAINTVQDTEEEGDESFTIEIKESDPEIEMGVSTANGKILDDDEAPDAKDDLYSVNEDSSFNGNVMTNDLGLGDFPVTVISHVSASNGSVIMNPDGTFTYTPLPDFNGDYSFTYTIQDVDGDQSTATVKITVNSVSDIPIANDDTYTSPEDIQLTGNVTDNDKNLVDLPIAISLTSNVSNGTLKLNADGTFTYLPNREFYGIDNFSYKVTDGDGDAVTANVAINVTFINDAAPVAVNDAVSTNEDTSVTIDILANDTDIDGNSTIDRISTVIKSDPSHGTLSVISTTGEYIYTPNNNYTGVDNFTYTIKDASSLESNIATVSINVTVDNDLPVASCQSGVIVYLDENGNYILDPTEIDDGSNDDKDGGTVSLSVSPNTFNCDDKGSVDVVLTVTDTDNAKSTCSTTITVVDNTLPTIKTVQDDINVFADAGVCSAVVHYSGPVFTDNCDGDQSGRLYEGAVSGSSFDVGTTKVSYQYNDVSNNGMVSSSFTITVSDNQVPIFGNSSDQNLQVNANNCQYLVSGTALDLTATDNCEIRSLTHNYKGGGTSLDGKTFAIGTTDVTWTAVDIHNNTSTKIVKIIIGSSLNAVLNIPTGNKVCGDDEDPIFIINATGGTLPYHYEFIIVGDPVIKNISENEYQISNLISGDLVKVKVTDANGCQVESNEITMTIYPKLSPQIYFN